jgi:Flp pilus assembly protein TadB
MGQVGIAGVLAAMLLAIAKAFIGSIDRRVKERDEQHTAELSRLTAQHERELGDMRDRARAWEATADRREATNQELISQNGRLQAGSETAVQLLRALHQVQGREIDQA